MCLTSPDDRRLSVMWGGGTCARGGTFATADYISISLHFNDNNIFCIFPIKGKAFRRFKIVAEYCTSYQ